MVKEEVYPNEIVAAVGDIVYFTVRDRRCYLWKSDGTPAGTVMVANLFYCPYPEDFFATENLLFIANEGIDPELGNLGEELWKSDGTEAGTGLVKDINPGLPGSRPDYFFDVNGLLYFTATTENWRTFIWKSDGSEIATRIVVPDMEIYSIEAVLGDTLFFRYNNGVSGNEPWMVTVEAIEDSDSDGIMDVVDGWWDDGPQGTFHDESGTFSDNFTDQHIDGKSFGFIQNRADHSGLIVTVDDAPNTGDGLLITASGDTTKAARIRICDLSPPGGRVELTNGDSIIVTCGSMEMQVLEGPVELFLNDDNVKVIAGDSAIILVTESGDGQLQVENLSETVNITIEVEGVSVELGPADHLQSAAIDILPADTENCINTKKKGKIPVAIFGSSEFDVTLIDPATCLLEEDHGISTRGKAGTPMAGIEDVNLDGFSDLVLQFEVEGSTFAGKTAATVTCEFDAGQVTVSGYDAICTVHKN